MLSLGDHNAGTIVEVPFNTNALAGQSISIATDGVVGIYRDGGMTSRTSQAGITFIEDHAGNIGTHLIRIDLADDTDPGFYASGSSYKVKYQGATIDGKAINAWLASFSIEMVVPLTAEQIEDIADQVVAQINSGLTTDINHEYVPGIAEI